MNRHRWHPDLKEWVKKSPAEIKQERLDRQAARRKKIEEKAQRKKEKEEKEKAEQEAKAKAESNQSQSDNDQSDNQSDNPDDKKETEPGTPGHEDHPDGDQGIKEPPKEPVRLKRRNAEPEYDEDGIRVLERETSGLKHLRRRPWI